MKETIEQLGLTITEFPVTSNKLSKSETKRCIYYFSKNYSQCYIYFKRLTNHKISKQITNLQGSITLFLPEDLEELKYFINL